MRYDVLYFLGVKLVKLGVEGRVVRLLTKEFTCGYFINDRGNGRVWLTDCYFLCNKYSVIFG